MSNKPDLRADDTRPGATKVRACPTPDKVGFRTQTAAQHQAFVAARKFGPARAYLCPCGHWHVTSKRAFG